jgi:hypothetical protein
LTIVVSRISMNAASVTETAISQGLNDGFQPVCSASAPPAALPLPFGLPPLLIAP